VATKPKPRKSTSIAPAKKVKAEPVSEDEVPLAKKGARAKGKAKGDVKARVEEKKVKRERKVKE